VKRRSSAPFLIYELPDELKDWLRGRKPPAVSLSRFIVIQLYRVKLGSADGGAIVRASGNGH
jgi:hypothetical protein